MYSLDFRKKVFEVQKEKNWNLIETADFFNISRNTLTRWKRNIEPSYTRNKPNTKIDEKKLEKEILERPDVYLSELAEKFGVSTSGIWKALQKLGKTYKKNELSSKGK
jgi:transposase